MDKIITFRPYKVFDNGEDKFIFNIDTTAIYKVDDKTLKIAQMSGNANNGSPPNNITPKLFSSFPFSIRNR